EGWEVTVDPTTGTTTVTPPADAQPGDLIQVPVVVTYPDGSTDDATVPVTVGAPDEVPTEADDNTPGYNPGRTNPGIPVDVPQTGDTELPDGTEFTLPEGYTPPEGWEVTVDPTTGTTTVTPPSDAQPGDLIQVPIVVTYPDGSTDDATVPVTVGTPGDVTTQADDNNPAYDPGDTVPGIAVDLPQTGDTDMPDGTEYTLPEDYTPPTGWEVVVDPTTGTVTITPPAAAQPGDSIIVPVLVTYPDDSSEQTPAQVIVTGGDAADFQPVYESVQVIQDGPAVIAGPPAGDQPAGTTYAPADGTQDWASVNPDGTVSVQVGYDVPVGPYDVPVTVNYPDGTSEVVNVPVSVINADDASYLPTVVTQGGTATVAAPLEADGVLLPVGTTFEAGVGTPPWAMVDPLTGEITLTPGFEVPAQAITIPVAAMLPSGELLLIDAPVFVQAAVSNPVYQDATVNQGETALIATPTNPDGTAIVPGSTFASADGVPAWATVNPDGTISVAPGTDVVPGTYTIPVTVTYPDGTTGVAQAKVTVVGLPDDTTTEAEDNNPGYNPGRTNPGTPVDVPQTVDTELPDGTEFILPEGYIPPEGWEVDVDPTTGTVTVTPPADATPGDLIQVPVVVTYPDGSTDDATVPVTVGTPDEVPTEADDHNPGYNPGTTKPGTTVDVEQTVDTELPDGTEFSIPEDYTPPAGWEAEVDPTTGTVTVTPPADAAPGDLILVPVVVTYPDGSSETVVSTVTVGAPDVTPTEADENQPDYQPESTVPGTPVDVTQDADLPEGTEFTLPEGYTPPAGWDVVVDPTTGTVTVTPPADAAPGAVIQVPIVATYPDGSQDNVTATVAVGMDDLYYPGTQVQQGGTATVSTPRGPDGGPLPDDVEFRLGDDAPEWASLNEDGSITVTPGRDVLPGFYTIPVEVTDADGNTIILPAVVQVTPAAPVVDDPSSPPSSSYSQRCAAAGVTVGLPLLFLIPLGLAAQVNMPGLSPMISQIQGQIEQTNANLQRNLGIFDPNAAQFVEQLNAMLNENGQAGQIIGGAALVAAGLLVSSYLHDNCVGGGSSTSSASSLSSGSSSS
ncbi:Rib/alpha-like domain-containing protein, partial [Corynebacterium sp.]|uniref:Rib/alpha-like domain-containing protein n=1 Tax=Corynebacterium sp. TaxID=1720 RepID=UPI0026DEDC2B